MDHHRQVHSSSLLSTAAFLILIFGIDSPGSAEGVDLPRFPPLPREGEYLKAAEATGVTLQEDIFIRRELLEDFLGTGRASAIVSDDFDRLLNIYGEVSSTISREDLLRMEWRVAKNQVEGDMARCGAQIVLKYEEIDLIALRILAGEKILSKDLRRLQLEVRGLAVVLAEIRIQRSTLDQNFFQVLFDNISRLNRVEFASRENYIEDLIQLKRANEALEVDRRRLAMAQQALDIVRRQSTL
jgi:hypothetical protein